MIPAQQAGEAILEKPNVAEAISGRRHAAQRQVKIASIETFDNVESAACTDVQSDQWRFAGHRGGQWCRYHEGRVVVGRNDEVPCFSPRLEDRFTSQGGG
jgi:hypothetical protein